jgi:hypothetical protein
MAEIISNGSKFAGEEPDTIEQLIDVLQTETLDPRFEEYGRFFCRLPNGKLNAFRNFLHVSHVFNIIGTLDELRPLAVAIKQNRKSIAYLLELRSRGRR